MFALLDCAPDETVSVEPDADLFERPDSRRLQIELQHVHLPYLSEYGFVDWRRTEQQIAPGPEFEPVREPLAAVRQYAEENESS